MQDLKHQNKPKWEFLNILNYTIIQSACILHWAIFLLYSLNDKTHKINLTFCLKNVDKPNRGLIKSSNF